MHNNQSNGDIGVQPEDATAPVGSDGVPAPIGPGMLEIEVPGGAFVPNFASPPTRSPDKSWVNGVDESLVLCPRCEHSWIMLKYAPTMNTKPDGKPFMQRESYCTYPAQNPGGAPLPLEMRFVLKCNRFKLDPTVQAKGDL